MIDIEKLRKGLEIHTKPNSRCVGCPYPNNGLCGDQLYVGAIALLNDYENLAATHAVLVDAVDDLLATLKEARECTE